MVIGFSHPKARHQLLECGVVYTARKRRRKNVGRNWANKGRLTGKIADVYIAYMGEVKVSELGPYVAQSGFPGLHEWYLAIKGYIPDISMNKKVHLYRVERA